MVILQIWDAYFEMNNVEASLWAAGEALGHEVAPFLGPLDDLPSMRLMRV